MGHVDDDVTMTDMGLPDGLGMDAILEDLLPDHHDDGSGITETAALLVDSTFFSVYPWYTGKQI